MKELLDEGSIAARPLAVVIMITAYGNIELAVQALKVGATDFIQKPWDDEKLLSTILTGYKLRRSKLEIDQLKNKQKHLNQKLNGEYQHYKGESPAMKEVYATLSKVAATEANVLILGENGTGKELIAERYMRNPYAPRKYLWEWIWGP